MTIIITYHPSHHHRHHHHYHHLHLTSSAAIMGMGTGFHSRSHSGSSSSSGAGSPPPVKLEPKDNRYGEGGGGGDEEGGEDPRDRSSTSSSHPTFSSSAATTTVYRLCSRKTDSYRSPPSPPPLLEIDLRTSRTAEGAPPPSATATACSCSALGQQSLRTGGSSVSSSETTTTMMTIGTRLSPFLDSSRFEGGTTGSPLESGSNASPHYHHGQSGRKDVGQPRWDRLLVHHEEDSTSSAGGTLDSTSQASHSGGFPLDCSLQIPHPWPSEPGLSLGGSPAESGGGHGSEPHPPHPDPHPALVGELHPLHPHPALVGEPHSHIGLVGEPRLSSGDSHCSSGEQRPPSHLLAKSAVGSPARLLEHKSLGKEEKLVAATLATLNQSVGPSNIIKQDLRLVIQSRRKAEGKEELLVDFKEPPKEELSEEEWQRALKRRDQNRRAAQRFRHKQRQISTSLAGKVRQLEATHTELLSEMRNLEGEKLSLLQRVYQHSRVCKDFDFKLRLQQALGYRLTSDPRKWPS